MAQDDERSGLVFRNRREAGRQLAGWLGRYRDHELVVLSTPLLFWAVGAFYEDFGQVSDDEVCELLAQAKHEERRPHDKVVGQSQ
jgi:predicted phosphoribosyltransferase